MIPWSAIKAFGLGVVGYSNDTEIHNGGDAEFTRKLGRAIKIDKRLGAV